eukprot:19671_1
MIRTPTRSPPDVVERLLDETASSANTELTDEVAPKQLQKQRSNSHYTDEYGDKHSIDADEESDTIETIELMNEMQLLINTHDIDTHKTGTIFSSTLNLSNTVVGAGLFGLPAAIRNSGYIMAMFLFIIASCTSLYTLHLTMCVSMCVEHASYDALCSITVPKLRKVVDFAIWFTCFGICVAYFVVIGDSMDLAMEQFLQSTDQKIVIFGYETYSFWINRYFWMILYLVLFITPTISLRKMDSLKFTSFFALFTFAVFMVMITLYWTLDSLNACHDHPAHSKTCNHGITAFPTSWIDFAKTTPIFIFAYECHTNAWPIRNELERPSITRLTKVSLNTVVLCTTIYGVIGYAGYLTYGENVKSNILNNYPQTPLVGVIRVGLAFAIAFSYPLVSYVAREVLSTLLFDKAPNELEWYKFYGMTYWTAILSVVIAMVMDDLEVVLSLIGAIGGTSITLIFPGLFYYNLGHHPVLAQSTYHSCKRRSCIVLIIAGVVTAVGGVTLQFI